ncbi:MAG TPA: cupin domain-containing protein [Chloroflexota bacterium]|nr:cupin domain-containing protein [Chloroflexota bacterium]
MATEAISAQAAAAPDRDALATFEAELAGHWQEAVYLPTEPYVRIQPRLWRWETIHRQLLRAGERTRRHRHTSCSIYHVVRGRGCTVVNDTRLDWGPGDVFVVPNWSWHAHENAAADADAVLFSMNDIPVYQAFGLYREQADA